ncbi:MAG: rhamnogalacturonan lyase B N-terminal domain-containing protein [Verrucomicrobiota bacterium]
MKLLLALLLAVQTTRAEFSLKDDGKSFTIDCESTPKVVVQINKTNGNIQSLLVNGTQLQTNPRGSHINSGFGKCEVTAKPFGDDRILVTVNSMVTHYYAFKKGEPNIFMATWAATCPNPGEMRFIARLDSKVLNKGNLDRPGDDASGKAIESKDIFIQSDGRTTSKYYSGVKFIDDAGHGSRGSNVGAYFVIGSYESSAGGPFFRDINSQTAGDTEEMYFYMFSGHAQTEEFRKNQLHGPYALCFTAGPPPTMPAMGWMKDLGLKGWVAERGRVTGTATGLMPNVPYTVYLSNDTAQYWTRVPPNGKFTTSSMKPGNYTVRLMRNELAVAKSTVTVGTDTVTANLTDPGLPPYLWRLGLPDGTPSGFRNADKMGSMHPSDKRHEPWGPLTFTVRDPVPSNLQDFPAAQFADVNNGNKIVFKLAPDEVKDRDLEIGVTVSQYGSRPIVRLNDWKSRDPGAPQSYDSRSITFGIYRGFDKVFTIHIPKSAFKAGTNTLTIDNLSGSGARGFISNAFVFDYVGLRD